MADVYAHPDALAFLAAIIASPDDDLPRLVYADWLDENGEGEHGDFIRTQIELARRAGHYHQHKPGPAKQVCNLCFEHDALRARERWLLLEHWKAWTPLIRPGATFEVVLSQKWQFSGTPAVVFRRGFVGEVRCTLADWCGSECSCASGRSAGRWFDGCTSCAGYGTLAGIGPAVVAAHPVRTVTPTDRGIAVYDATMEVWVLDYSALPDDVIALLPHKYARWVRPEVLYFESEQLALAALSAALIAVARR